MTKVEELREAVVEGVVNALEEKGRHDSGLIGPQIVDSLISAAHAEGMAEGAGGVMSCPLYTHGWANDDDRQGEVHCCDRKGHEISWNPDEMRDELIAAGIDPASVLAPTKESEKSGAY